MLVQDEGAYLRCWPLGSAGYRARDSRPRQALAIQFPGDLEVGDVVVDGRHAADRRWRHLAARARSSGAYVSSPGGDR